MTIPPIYRNDRERAIASFSFIEFASGTGVIRFQGFNTIDDTTTSFRLSENSVRSHTAETSIGQGAISDTSFTMRGDVDFDLTTFKKSQKVSGTANLSVSFGLRDITPNTPDADMYIIAKVRKFDGSSETDLGSAQSQTINESSGEAQKTGRASLSIALTDTNFAIGDILRLTIEGWHKHNSGANSVNLFLAHSPNNLDGTVITVADVDTTQLYVDIPFKIDL